MTTPPPRTAARGNTEDGTAARARKGAEWLCPYPWTALQVMNTDGDAYPCCWSHTSIGNIKKQQAHEVWSSPEAQRFRHDLRYGHYHRHCSSTCPNLLTESAGSVDTLLGTALSQGGGVATNARQALRDYQSRKELPTSLPSLLRVFPTNRCGIQCGMCSIWATKPKRDFGVLPNLKPVLRNAAVLEATGGEPLMSGKLLSFLSSAPLKFPRLKYAMITNGLRLSNAVDSGQLPSPDMWEWVGLSLDSHTSRTLSRIRQGLSANGVLAALRALLTWSEGVCRIAVLTVLMRPNLKDVEALAERLAPLAERHPNLKMSVSMIHGTWPGLSDFSHGEMRRIIAVASRLEEEFPFVLNASTVALTARIRLAQTDIGLPLDSASCQKHSDNRRGA